MDKFTTLKTRVGLVLNKYPETRADDGLLWITVLKKYYLSGKSLLRLNDLLTLPKESSVRRMRADFNSHKLYLPTREHIEKRKIKAKKSRQYYNRQSVG
jgi:hypothetical protein